MVPSNCTILSRAPIAKLSLKFTILSPFNTIRKYAQYVDILIQYHGKIKPSSIAHLLATSLGSLLQHFALACHRWAILHVPSQWVKEYHPPPPCFLYLLSPFCISLERSAVPDPLPPYQCPYERPIATI